MHVSEQPYEIDIAKTGDRLKQLRKARNYSVADLQRLLGCACVQTIYFWEQGRALPSVYYLLALAKLYDLHIEDLIITYDSEQQNNKGMPSAPLHQ